MILKPNDLRAKKAINTIWFMLILNIVSIFFSFLYYVYCSSSNIVQEELDLFDVAFALFSFIYLTAHILCAVNFIKWLRRAYYNMEQVAFFNPDKRILLKHKNSDAASSWFIPFVNFYRPYKIVQELYEELNSICSRQFGFVSKELQNNVVSTWWALWIISTIVNRLSFQYSSKAQTIEALANSALLDILSGVLTLVAGFLLIKIVKDYAKYEHYLFELKKETTSDNE